MLSQRTCFLGPDESKRTAEELREEIGADAHKGGWGNQASIDQEWSNVMLYVIRKKEEKLLYPKFTRYDEDWLLIRDAWPLPFLNPENAIEHLFCKIQSGETNLAFHRVFVVSRSNFGPICEVTESAVHVYPRNDLWGTHEACPGRSI